jgi:hypothetical protein
MGQFNARGEASCVASPTIAAMIGTGPVGIAAAADAIG